MKKLDLRVGNVVEDRSGNRYLFTESVVSTIKETRHFICLNGYGFILNHYYDENLKHKIDEKKDIVAVYSSEKYNRLLWADEKYKKRISTEENSVVTLMLLFGYKYAARDKDETLYFYKHKPNVKTEKEWAVENKTKCSINVKEFDELFEFIRFIDDKPCYLKELKNV